jgi:hypothetical protein
VQNNGKQWWWGRISLVWLLLPIVGAVAFTLTTTISPNDFWWHAAVGRWIAHHSRIPVTNLYAWSVPPSTHYTYQNWLAEWLIFQVLRWGGISAIFLWRSAAVAVTFAILAMVAMRRAKRVTNDSSADWDSIHFASAARACALALFISLAMIALNLDARPQTFALPFFALTVALLFELPYLQGWRAALAAAALAAVTVLWANFHGSFFMAPVVMIIALGAETLYGWTQPLPASRQRLWGRALPARSLRAVLGIAVASCLATLVNPLGSGLFLYVLRLSGNTTVQRFMYEWQAPSWREGSSVVFFSTPLVLLLVGAGAYRRAAHVGRLTAQTQLPAVPPKPEAASLLGPLGVRFGEVMVLLLLFTMGQRNIRSILWYALFFAPFMCACAAASSAATSRVAVGTAAGNIHPFPSRAVQIANGLVLVCLLLAPVPLLPRFKAGLPWPAAFRARFAPTPPGRFPVGFDGEPPLLLDKTTPVAAAEYLRRFGAGGELFNDMACGSYLMWALPRMRVAADPRIELYPADYWKRYLLLARGPANAHVQLAFMQVGAALLDPDAEPGLIARLRHAPGWRQVPLRDSHAVLLRRITAPILMFEPRHHPQ